MRDFKSEKDQAVIAGLKITCRLTLGMWVASGNWKKQVMDSSPQPLEKNEPADAQLACWDIVSFLSVEL